MINAAGIAEKKEKGKERMCFKNREFTGPSAEYILADIYIITQ
jgi:hypothetical protein